MNKLTPYDNLELSIKALSAYNVEPAIIADMLKQLKQIKGLNKIKNHGKRKLI